MEKGTLYVRVQKATLINDHAWFSEMTPYFYMTIGQQCIKSNFAWGQGLNPQWKDQNTKDFNLGISIMHHKKCFGRDDFIGQYHTNIKSQLTGQLFKMNFNIFDERVFQGIVEIHLQFIPFSSQFTSPLMNSNYSAEYLQELQKESSQNVKQKLNEPQSQQMSLVLFPSSSIKIPEEIEKTNQDFIQDQEQKRKISEQQPNQQSELYYQQQQKVKSIKSSQIGDKFASESTKENDTFLNTMDKTLLTLSDLNLTTQNNISDIRPSPNEQQQKITLDENQNKNQQ